MKPESTPMANRASAQILQETGLPLPDRRTLRPANDNNHGFSNDVLLRAALRHFAEYGLGAAEQARRNAEDAFFAGDRRKYGWWLEICRTLDRRMAGAVAARGGQAAR